MRVSARPLCTGFFAIALPLIAASPQFPEAPGKDVVQKVCTSCHGPEVTIATGRTAAQWKEVVAGMVSRGAKGTDQELAIVVDYLAKNIPPDRPTAATSALPRAAVSHPRNNGAGPADVHFVDIEGAKRGRAIYAAECVTCHGNSVRGGEGGTDLVRSITVLHDRYGSTLGPFLRKHNTQSGRPGATFTDAEISDVADFLHQRIKDSLRSGPYSKVINVLTGDAKAGEAYFNGAGTCNTCHSPTGDLAGIAKRFDPPNLQQRFLFPRGGGRSKPVTVTVTVANSGPVTGVVDQLDDFTVTLHSANGEFHSFARTPDTQVVKNDPYKAHYELLDQYSDKNIHDLVAYLATLK